MGQKGEFHRAQGMIQELGFESCGMVWRSLLGACGTQEDLHVAEIAASKLIELERDQDYVYVMLSNSAPGKIIPSTNCRRGTIGKWLHQKQHRNANMSVKRKDRARVENVRVHSAVSIAGLASTLASLVASSDNHSKLDFAMASATQFLASYCVKMAELAGADHDRVASTVKSAVDIQTPGDLITLTAAAAICTCLTFLSMFKKSSQTRRFNSLNCELTLSTVRLFKQFSRDFSWFIIKHCFLCNNIDGSV
ncbi:unnamed protein product [Trifolium pratense]|uniref:Uncharacterized protein n=1 Tax=Trifolium pratense TaxID=57577 RepID=A0ACB0K1K2_TRIPR|nr:unnamed protein product [Trifolium pratense]